MRDLAALPKAHLHLHFEAAMRSEANSAGSAAGNCTLRSVVHEEAP